MPRMVQTECVTDPQLMGPRCKHLSDNGLLSHLGNGDQEGAASDCGV
jgi:hypothetical protein